MKKITVKELETDGVLEDIFDKYDQGDRTVYEIFYNDGQSSGCMLIPYEKYMEDTRVDNEETET